MSNKWQGILALIIGPSGVGKGTTINILKQKHDDWVFPVSATTRRPRPDEVDGKDYHFLTPTEFEQRVQRDDFLEWAWVHGEKRYGLLKSDIIPALEAGKVIIREVDIQGFTSIRQKLPPENLISFFLLPPSRNVLIERIQDRAPIDEAELKRRLASMEHEVEHAKDCDYQIQTEDCEIGLPARKIAEILQKEVEKRGDVVAE